MDRRARGRRRRGEVVRNVDPQLTDGLVVVSLKFVPELLKKSKPSFIDPNLEICMNLSRGDGVDSRFLRLAAHLRAEKTEAPE